MNIDWNNIESVFVKDNLYEHFNAPKYFDFSAHEESIDDDAWFCRPGNISKTLDSINSPNLSHCSFEFLSEIPFSFSSDCQHPKKAEDFKVCLWNPRVLVY